jgi:hypothetical protein
VGILGCFAPDVWAGGPGTGSAPACQVTKLSRHARTLKGTVAVEVVDTSADPVFGSNDVDFLFRLERDGFNLFDFFGRPLRGPAPKFFRLSLQIPNTGGLSNGDFLCAALGDPGLSAQILAAFGFPANSHLVITQNSITDTDESLAFLIPGTDGPNGNLGFVLDRYSSIADVTIFVVP